MKVKVFAIYGEQISITVESRHKFEIKQVDKKISAVLERKIQGRPQINDAKVINADEITIKELL